MCDFVPRALLLYDKKAGAQVQPLSVGLASLSTVVALTPLPPRYTYRGMTRVSDKIYTVHETCYLYNSREFTERYKGCLNL